LFRKVKGFTLLELLVVVAIIAVASAGVSLAMRDSAQTQLEREAVRLAALLESGRARSLATGVAVRWRSTAAGFEFDGLPSGALAQGWLSADVTSAAPTTLLLGPEPILLPQSVTLVSRSQTTRVLKVGSDGVRPFAVQSSDAASTVP
jgi:general secretion pathway protein H